MNGQDKPTMTARCEGGTGPDLTGFPTLTYAPSQWGDGIRLARNGEEIEDIVKDAEDRGLVSLLFKITEEYSISLEELCDAIRYIRTHTQDKG